MSAAYMGCPESISRSYMHPIFPLVSQHGELKGGWVNSRSYTREREPHSDQSLQDQRHERHDIHTHMVLRHVQHDLQEQRREGDARPAAPVGENGQERDDSKDDRAGCRVGYRLQRGIQKGLRSQHEIHKPNIKTRTVVLGDPIIDADATAYNVTH